ncbi:ABC transporter permease [Ferribacterium limneticum]|uniref:ABC transporter permease n=1 Tax=Ferribacterium limneticum TaxID=76259 RepID=UPI001CF84BF1|nr:ABC transporter permease [Ferribacterium limneticum]UCV23634.1 ABC transporter permease [Ferribacterium limneticum]
MNVRRIVALAYKELREILRDRLFFSLAFVVPASLMLVFGYGLTLDVEHIPFAVVDWDKSAMSRDYLHRYIDSRYFDYKGDVASERELAPLLADSRIRLAIVIPPRFQEDLISGRAVGVQTLIDGTFPFRTSSSKGYVVAINAAFNSELLESYISRWLGVSTKTAKAIAQPVRVQLRYLYNQEVKSVWTIAPVLMMFVLMITPPFLTALGVVREKENGSIYNIYASTVTRGEFLIGKLAPYVGISVINFLILWLMAAGLFGAPFKGDPLFFFLASAIYVTCTTGIGLFVSIFVRTQVAAMMLTVIVTIIPSVLYSGLLVPIASMDPAGQFEAHLFPAMYYADIVLGSFLKGVGLEQMWGKVLALLVYAVVLWTASFLMFHKRPKS